MCWLLVYMQEGRGDRAPSRRDYLQLSVSVAWFLCDDAFISFRYARNLLEGHGLVFNPGEFVEGYWRLCVSAGSSSRG